MKVELSDTQIKQLITIIANSQIRGSDASAILELAKAIQTPVKENVNPEVKPKEK